KLQADIYGDVSRIFRRLIGTLPEMEEINSKIEQLLSVPDQFDARTKREWLAKKASLLVEIARIRTRPRQEIYHRHKLQGGHFVVDCWIDDIEVDPKYEKLVKDFSVEMDEAEEREIRMSKDNAK